MSAPIKVAICGPNLRDQSKGQFHVHAAGCGDLKHYGGAGKFGGERPMFCEAASALEVAGWLYDDHLSDYGLTPDSPEGREKLRSWLSEVHFCPCVKFAEPVVKPRRGAVPEPGTEIKLRKVRSTGTVVAVVVGNDPEEPWETICVDHGGVCSHETKKLAVEFARHPEEWCEDCMYGPGTLDGSKPLDEAPVAPPRPEPPAGPVAATIVKSGRCAEDDYCQPIALLADGRTMPMGWNLSGLIFAVGTTGTAEYVVRGSSGMWQFTPDPTPAPTQDTDEAPEPAGDPNADLVGYAMTATDGAVLTVTGGTMLAQYVAVEIVAADGSRSGSWRPAALVRQHKLGLWSR